ncbi:aminopeptidase [Lacrimispora saccharolytica]|nr:aminopeptidase [Lacrimispora saccharolytica]
MTERKRVMTDYRNDTEERELLEERRKLSLERIRQIPEEKSVPVTYREYFAEMAKYIVKLQELEKRLKEGILEHGSMEELQALNVGPYRDILPEMYEHSYGNPAYAAKMLGEGYGQMLSFLYAEIQGMVVSVYEGRLWDCMVVMELFLEIYHMFEEEEFPTKAALRDVFYWYVSDYTDETMEYRIREMVDPTLDFASGIVRKADLTDLRYLYRYGEYVTENERKTAEFLNGLPQEQIDAMARTYTEGYRIGFVLGNKDLSKKKTVNIRYHLGFERMVRAAILQFEEMGLQPVIYRSAVHGADRNRRGLRTGYSGAVPNKQFDYDHKEDAALFLDEDLVQRRLRAMQVAYEKHKEEANTHAGPAVIEIFGEKPFSPKANKDALSFNEKQQKLQVRYDNEAGQITNRYIIGEERSFTIIAYPVPEIGEQFEEIFRETVKINTLDYRKYQRIQQHLIDALDQGTRVHVKGKGENRTDLWIQLHKLEQPEKQTNFENCVADVNIPVGEVFTSPVLKGTNGVLHVTSVYLNELNYQNLCLTLTDGMITDYGCTNFEQEGENRKYIEANILNHHKTLPIGEFAIGTNTTAYVVAEKYQIADKLPILIAEKMGPHFAMGDTCYSWAEDTAVFNPDGKEIIARDNEISILRKEDPGKAYFGCHTDITIPYDELDYIRVQKEDGSEVSLIEDGRFVLPGTEELNEAFQE